MLFLQENLQSLEPSEEPEPHQELHPDKVTKALVYCCLLYVPCN